MKRCWISNVWYGWLVVMCSMFVKLHASAIVFVHIGDALPSYLAIAVQQAQLFNPNSDVFVVGSKQALASFASSANKVPYESLIPSQEHLAFSAHFSQPRFLWPNPLYWRYVIERFFYLDELLTQYHLDNVVHLENDVMIYFELEALLPTFERFYPNVGATFLNDAECMPGLVYIAKSESLRPLMTHFATLGVQQWLDSEIMSHLRHMGPMCVAELPLFPISYAQMVVNTGEGLPYTVDPFRYSAHAEEFDSLFDVATIGQYLGGLDPIHNHDLHSYIRPGSVFDPRVFEYGWEQDMHGRKIPYLYFKDRKHRLNNLHVHCKRLEEFRS